MEDITNYGAPLADSALQGELIERFADFFDPDAITAPPYQLRRWTLGGGRRHYFEIDPEMGAIDFYPGITGLLKEQMPTPFALIKWIADNGLEDSATIRDAAADYGTAMHIVFAAFLLGDAVDFDTLPETLPKWDNGWRDRLHADLLAFAAFVADRNVKPLAIEAMIRSRALGYACTVDLVCRMDVGTGVGGNITQTDIKKGTVQTVVAVVDFKSGRKGFYESHQIQAEACRLAWNENAIGPIATRSFNWAPKEWVGSSPSYTLKEQTSEIAIQKLVNYTNLYKLDHPETEPKPIRVYDRVVGQGVDPSTCFRDISVGDIIRRRYGLVAQSSVEVGA